MYKRQLQECFARQGDYAQRLTDARAAQEALRAQVAAAAQQMRIFSSTLGDSDSATIAARANLDALKTEYRACLLYTSTAGAAGRHGTRSAP